MLTKPMPTDQILALLAAAPERIAAATAAAPPDLLHASPGPGEWSANAVLAHLRSCADVWGGAIATILAEEHPTIRAVDPRTWMLGTDYPEQPFAASFRAFAAQRADLLALLDSLPPEGWARAATVTGAGRPLGRTVRAYAQWLAKHERPHVRQIERAVRALGG